MTTEQFIDNLWNTSNSIQELFDEMYWEDNASSNCFEKFIRKQARALKLELSDIDSFDFDKCFSELYDCCEKGLS